MKKLIAFAGPKAAGKTTAARYLAREHGYVIISFAAPLKDFLIDFMQFEPEQVYTLEGKERMDPRYGVSPRRVMEAFGTDFIRKTVPDFWVVKMKVTLMKEDGLVAIDDARFEAELDLVRKLGGTVVHIEGRGHNIRERKHWLLRWFLPESERGVKVKPGDIIINNSGSYTELQQKLKRITAGYPSSAFHT